MTLNTRVSASDLAAALSCDPEVILDVLADLADEDGDGELLSTDIQQQHSCSRHHRGVAPFLRRIADKLEAIEAEEDT